MGNNMSENPSNDNQDVPQSRKVKASTKQRQIMANDEHYHGQSGPSHLEQQISTSKEVMEIMQDSLTPERLIGQSLQAPGDSLDRPEETANLLANRLPGGYDPKDFVPTEILSFLYAAGKHLQAGTYRMGWDYANFKVAQLGLNDAVCENLVQAANEIGTLKSWSLVMNDFGETLILKINELFSHVTAFSGRLSDLENTFSLTKKDETHTLSFLEAMKMSVAKLETNLNLLLEEHNILSAGAKDLSDRLGYFHDTISRIENDHLVMHSSFEDMKALISSLDTRFNQFLQQYSSDTRNIRSEAEGGLLRTEKFLEQSFKENYQSSNAMIANLRQQLEKLQDSQSTTKKEVSQLNDLKIYPIELDILQDTVNKLSEKLEILTNSERHASASRNTSEIANIAAIRIAGLEPSEEEPNRERASINSSHQPMGTTNGSLAPDPHGITATHRTCFASSDPADQSRTRCCLSCDTALESLVRNLERQRNQGEQLGDKVRMIKGDIQKIEREVFDLGMNLRDETIRLVHEELESSSQALRGVPNPGDGTLNGHASTLNGHASTGDSQYRTTGSKSTRALKHTPSKAQYARGQLNSVTPTKITNDTRGLGEISMKKEIGTSVITGWPEDITPILLRSTANEDLLKIFYPKETRSEEEIKSLIASLITGSAKPIQLTNETRSLDPDANPKEPKLPFAFNLPCPPKTLREDTHIPKYDSARASQTIESMIPEKPHIDKASRPKQPAPTAFMGNTRTRSQAPKPPTNKSKKKSKKQAAQPTKATDKQQKITSFLAVGGKRSPYHLNH